MAAVAKKVQPPKQAQRPAIASKMAPGKAALKMNARLITIYAPPKCGKTSALRTLKAKWVITDPNTVPTLQAFGCLPHPDDTYEVESLDGANEVVANALKVVEEGGLAALGDIEAMVFDSLSQLVDWHKEDVAKLTGQRWLGDNMKNNGWNQFNVQMGRLIDNLIRLSRYIHVVLVCHAQPKPDADKGKWAGLSLSPQLAEKVGRSCNWLLFMTSRDLTEAEALEFGLDDPFIQVIEGRRGKKSYVERAIHTIPYSGTWNAAVNASKLSPEEPPDLRAMLVKEGLL